MFSAFTIGEAGAAVGGWQAYTAPNYRESRRRLVQTGLPRAQAGGLPMRKAPSLDSEYGKLSVWKKGRYVSRSPQPLEM